MTPAWRAFTALCAAYVASQFYRGANAVIAPELMRDLGLSPEALGAITGSFFLAFAAAQLPAGVMLDRLGPRRTMTGLMFVAVAGSLAFAVADGPALLTVGRSLMGVGCAVGLMGSMVVIARWFPPHRFAPLSAILFAIGGLGGQLATTPLGAAAQAFGRRGAFVGMAALTAVLAVILYAGVRDAPPGAATAGRKESLGEIARGLVEVFRNRQLRLVGGIQLVGYPGVITVIGLWGGPYLAQVHGLDPVARGNALLLLTSAMLAGALGYGFLDNRARSRKRLVLAGAVIGTLALGLAAALSEPPLWLALGLLTVFILFGSYFNLLHAQARAVLPDRLVGRGLTLQNMAAIGGVFFVQAATGLLVGSFAGPEGSAPEIAYRLVFASLSVISAAGIGIYALTDARAARPAIMPG